MSFKDSEFDIAMVSFGLHELHEDLMMRILEEMARVVKGSGRLYIVDYEDEKGFFKKLVFWIFLKLFEPKHMSRFLEYDWRQMLRGVGFCVTGTDKFFFSKLISATKVPP